MNVAFVALRLRGASFCSTSQCSAGLPTSPVKRSTNTCPQLELIAGKDEKRAVISLGHTSTNGLQWVAKLPSPWDDDENEGVPASLDGLANGIKLELSLTGLLFEPAELDVASLDAADCLGGECVRRIG